MEKGINVLSLFDGMSCGQIALDELGVKVENYFASEIDEPAIKVTQSNYPKTIQLGDVKKINILELPKIDLFIGGSPCQSFSSFGDGTGLDGKSGLFFEYSKTLKKLKEILDNQLSKKITNIYKLIFWDYEKNTFITNTEVNSWLKRINEKLNP